jgi:Ser/Thr protein kinase RdoA (MazF antagonist)
MTTQEPSPAFSEDSTRPVLAEACAKVGLDPAGASMLRLGENAMYRLESAPVVVRVARSLAKLDEVRKEIRVARWLESEGFPAVGLADENGEDVLVAAGQYPVTFWRYITNTPPDPSEASLGRLLRELHGLKPPDWLQLPDFWPFDRVADRLAAAPAAADPDDVVFLGGLHDRLREEYEGLSYVFPPSVIHGDAHLANLLRDESGQVLMLDFENTGFGQREWDLTVTGVRRDGFDWMTEAEYRSFADAYGFDIHTWPGFPVFRAIRELTMTTWLMQLVNDPRAAQEFHRRVTDIRTDRFPRRWQRF